MYWVGGQFDIVGGVFSLHTLPNLDSFSREEVVDIGRLGILDGSMVLLRYGLGANCGIKWGGKYGWKVRTVIRTVESKHALYVYEMRRRNGINRDGTVVPSLLNMLHEVR